MKVIAERALCTGHACCAAKCPEIYRLDEDGYIAIDVVEVPPELEAKASLAARACPEGAVRIEG